MESQKQEKEKSPAAFCLFSGSGKFESRSKDVFASLGALEEKHSAYLKSKPSYEDDELMKADPEEEGEDPSAVSKDRSNRGKRSHERSKLSETRDSDYERRSHSRSLERSDERNYKEVDERRGQNNFKRPFHPPHRPRVPDFKKNPESYTHYSLRAVPESDMSEQSNTRAALAFLEERRTEREKQERKLAGLPEEEPKFDVGDAACSQGLITFSRRKPKDENCETSTSTSKDSTDLSMKKTVLSVDDNDGDEITEKDGNNLGDNEDVMKETETSSFSSKPGFKSRRNMKRVIRKKKSDEEDDG